MIDVRINPFSSVVRPALAGGVGAVSAAHPLAVTAAQDMLQAGGSAVDAAIAAQAVIAVVAPDAAGLGGDGFYLVRTPDRAVHAVNGAGRTGRALAEGPTGPAAAVTVSGLVAAWGDLSRSWGRLSLAQVLAPAIRLARMGIRIDRGLADSVTAQRRRLLTGGAERWPLLHLGEGAHWEQPELAATLDQLAKAGSQYFYRGAFANRIAATIQRHGGSLDAQDFANHASVRERPLALDWGGLTVHVQPPASQGILLLMALQGLERLGPLDPALRDHAAIELIGSIFEHRHRVGEGAALLELEHQINFAQASNRAGPRAYLHTAGVCCADADGMVVSSLMSVFDDFGSAVFVPEGGFVLNNRADGFTATPNDLAPDKAPIHTLAPIMVSDDRLCLGLATPGADGQVQTLLQVLCACVADELDLAAAIHRPRWRSENGLLLIETGHALADALAKRGHKIQAMAFGDMRAGSVMSAGFLQDMPFAVADWRRHGWSGIA
ncbi:gamma-glutamyltransferase [uncultured Devosia sp.]|uniref:gamma-glutamyltransferase n=1 Tax=uncultured Devosia sp. TaxID=211434 RepID=UPI0035CBE96B